VTTFQQVIDVLRPTLNDSAKVRYNDAECLTYALDGLREICLARPDLFSISGEITCVTNQVEQKIPDTGWFLIEVYGVKGGDDVLEGDLDAFRAWDPDWRNATAAPAEVWMRLPESVKQQQNNKFYLFPPAPANQVILAAWVELNTSGFDLTTTVPLNTQYIPALEAYVVYRAEAKDDEHVNTNRAAMFRNAFNSMLGVGQTSEQVSP
jgi:hypothetical protein